MNAGVLHIYCETLDASLRAGVNALSLPGFRAHEASRAARMFFIHDERTMKRLSSIRNEDEYVSAAREGIEELERLIQADRRSLNLHLDEGWDETSLLKEA
jgi:CPA2 family monovalent cation:H+ antiporter-2/glutathione-regulated potassium-efflux system ancillary protein KefC/glutathione-regulated potassium-efflux system protein KefB